MAQRSPGIAGGPGAIQASGNRRSARSSWASVAASTLSFLQPGRSDRLAAAGMDQIRLQLQLLSSNSPPPAALGSLERHRGARRKGAKDRHQLGGIVSDVAVALGRPAASTMATWERPCTSIPTYTPIRACVPARLVPEA